MVLKKTHHVVAVIALLACVCPSTSRATSLLPTETMERVGESLFSPSGSTARSMLLKSLFLAPLGIALLLLAGLTLVPIPVISTGRGLKRTRPMELAKKVITSEECIERISCEISTLTRNYDSTSWIPRTIEKYMKHTQWMGKISKGLHATERCKQFSCNPLKTYNEIK